MPDEEPLVEPSPGALWDCEQLIESAICNYDKESDGDGAILTGWVVVAEWINADGEPCLSAFARENMPSWRINALLDAGSEYIVYADDDEY